MRTKRIAFILIAIVFLTGNLVQAQYLDQFIESESCTSVIVGKKASADGSTMTSHTCDSGSDRTWINLVPAAKYKAGSETPVYLEPKRTRGPQDPDAIEAGFIKQVRETYAFINTAYPVINEYQLAIGETTFGGKRELVSDEGLIDCPELYRLALQRAKTGREAIMVIDKLTKEYGYNDVGECFTFADPNETWHFEILGPGKGKVGAVWAAVRIPDDEVGVSANASRIRSLDLDDKENYMASDNVYSLAEEFGYWSKDSGKEFEFCYVYANRRSMACRRREWRVLSTVAPGLNLDPNGENYPLSVKPEKKLTVQDVLEIFRDYYQGTPYDMTNGLEVKDRRGNYVLSPVANPFMTTDTRNLLGIARERTIACSRATYVQVTQSRNWLPDPIGGIVWLGYDNPCTTPHIPFYCGITDMPESYMVDGRREYSRDCAWWSFRRVSQLSYMRYQPMSEDVKLVWKKMEDTYFENQEAFEKKMVDLYKKDKNKVRAELTKYSNGYANKAVERYWELGDELWQKYNNYF
ncbi:MAG: C69 family dipeptidase [Bacteroidales bacterium]|nr:C69 family dipeptidase [Bacteroidales bacterium]